MDLSQVGESLPKRKPVLKARVLPYIRWELRRHLSIVEAGTQSQSCTAPASPCRTEFIPFPRCSELQEHERNEFRSTRFGHTARTQADSRRCTAAQQTFAALLLVGAPRQRLEDIAARQDADQAVGLLGQDHGQTADAGGQHALGGVAE